VERDVTQDRAFGRPTASASNNPSLWSRHDVTGSKETIGGVAVGYAYDRDTHGAAVVDLRIE
jgi:hypothetical protein